jgi:regulator of cell morphogenesis and NO signaling
MSLIATKTVRELAVETPGATRIFEKLKIDYCCGGGKSLGTACAVAGADVDEVVRLLGEATNTEPHGVAPLNFQSMSVSDLTAYIIRKHHDFTREEIKRLQALLTKVCSVHGENHPELSGINVIFESLRDELEPHMIKEERILFPFMVALEMAHNDGAAPPKPPFGSVGNPIRMMMNEHDSAGTNLREMRELSNGFEVPPDVCISYSTLYEALFNFEQDLHQHIHLENNILFPRAVELEDELLRKIS